MSVTVVHIQGPIRHKALFKKIVIPKAKLQDTPLQDVRDITPSFHCYIRGCKLDAFDKCFLIGCLCENVIEFCKEHMDYQKHQKLLFN